MPKVDTVRTDQLLTNVLLAYTNDSFIADMILPTVPNLKDRTGKIGKLGNSHLRRYKSKRALYDESQHRITFEYSQDDTYSIEDYDLETYVPDAIAGQTRAPFNTRRDAAKITLDALRLERELALAEALHDTTILTNNITLSGTSQFDDYNNSTPGTVIEAGRTSVQNAIGREANGMALSRKVFNTLKRHPYFLNQVQGLSVLSGSKLIELLKDEFELDYVLVGKSIYVNSEEGQTETKTTVWYNDIVLFHRAKEPSILAPSFGYSFQLAGKNVKSTTRREPNANKGELIGAEMSYEDLILDADAAYLIKDATS